MGHLWRLSAGLLSLLLGASAPHDGAHDFDFDFGTWKSHIKHLAKPLSGSTDWEEWNGIVSVEKVWGGKANLETLEIDTQKGHFEGATLRLYNPESRQWSLYFSMSGDGTIGVPAVGEFKDGKGEFYDQEAYNGRMILVRQTWSNIMPNAHHFEQAFSADGGKTWEANWVADLTREQQ